MALIHVGQAAEHRNHQPSGAGAGVGPRVGEGSKPGFLAGDRGDAR
jgi:hypothetical protein